MQNSLFPLSLSLYLSSDFTSLSFISYVRCSLHIVEIEVVKTPASHIQVLPAAAAVDAKDSGHCIGNEQKSIIPLAGGGGMSAGWCVRVGGTGGWGVGVMPAAATRLAMVKLCVGTAEV